MERYGYSRMIYALGTLVLGLIAVMLSFFFVMLPGTLGETSYFLLVTEVVMILLFFVAGLGPLASYHAITEEGVVIRQGPLFRADVRFPDIAGIGLLEGGLPAPVRARWGIRMVPESRDVYVIPSHKDLVDMRLKMPVKVKIMGISKKTDRIVFNVNDPEGFVDTVRLYGGGRAGAT